MNTLMTCSSQTSISQKTLASKLVQEVMPQKILWKSLPLFLFCTPWKDQKTFIFLVFSWGIKREFITSLEAMQINVKKFGPKVFLKYWCLGKRGIKILPVEINKQIFLVKVNKINTGKRYEICSKLAIKTPMTSF